MRWIFLCFLTLFFSACSFTNYNKTMLKPSCEFKDNTAFDPIYRGLNEASLAKACKKYKKSNEYLKIANKSFKALKAKNDKEKIEKYLLAYIMDEKIAKYEGRCFEIPLLFMYEGYNYLALKDFKRAKIAFLLAYKKNENTKHCFLKQKALINKSYAYLGYDKELFKALIKKYEKKLENKKKYKNPYIPYSLALFSYLNKDYKQALKSLEEIASIYNKKELLEEELKIFKKRDKKYIFVVYESGQPLSLDSVYFSFPTRMMGDFLSLGIYAPILKENKEGKNILVNEKPLKLLMKLDDIIKANFYYNRNNILLKASLKTLAKARKILNKRDAFDEEEGIFKKLLSHKLSTNIIKTRPDTRAWLGLFKNIKILSLENKGLIEIKEGKKLLYTKKLDKNKDIILFIKSFTKDDKIQVQLLKN